MAIKPDAPRNVYRDAEEWLRAASSDHLRAEFAKYNLSFSEGLAYQVAFSSAGKPPKGKIGRRWEYWPESATPVDGRGLIILLRYTSDPVEVLTDLMAAHLAAALGITDKPDNAYRKKAVEMGLEGSPSSGYRASRLLSERLHAFAGALGPLPWGHLDWSTRPVGKAPKQPPRTHPAKCPVADCGYRIRLTRQWIADPRYGPPPCPRHRQRLVVDGIDRSENITIDNEAIEIVPASDPIPFASEGQAHG